MESQNATTEKIIVSILVMLYNANVLNKENPGKGTWLSALTIHNSLCDNGVECEFGHVSAILVELEKDKLVESAKDDDNFNFPIYHMRELSQTRFNKLLEERQGQPMLAESA